MMDVDYSHYGNRMVTANGGNSVSGPDKKIVDA